MSGVIQADPLPSFDHLKVIFGSDTAVFAEEDDWSYNLGYISFSTGDSIFASEFGSVDAEVKTSFGTLNGSLELPDTLDTVVYSFEDTLELGQSLTVSWSGSDADFYALYAYYSWPDSVDYWHHDYLDTFVAADSVIFEGSRFAHDGAIYIWRIDPINGPTPHRGAAGNMSGQGAGFLYYTNLSRSSQDKVIVVGEGLFGYLGEMPVDRCEMLRERTARARARITQGLGLDLE